MLLILSESLVYDKKKKLKNKYNIKNKNLFII